MVARLKRMVRMQAAGRSPLLRRPTIGLILLITFGMPFIGDVFGVRERALASFADAHAAPLRITSPLDSSTAGDGNLILIEGTASDPSDGSPTRVELSIDSSDTWLGVEQDANDATRWRFLWADPPKGFHRIHARAMTKTDGLVEHSIIVQVDDTWSSPYIVDNPYAVPGSYRKGQFHMHTTRSFDGWNSLSPAEDSLEYKRRGYQFVVMTDHEVVSNAQEVADEAFIVIPGFESTHDSGHITAPFATEAVDPSLSPQERIDAIAAKGGLAILAHPDWRVGWDDAKFRDLQGYTAFEIYNPLATLTDERQQYNTKLWTNGLNNRGWANRMWAVAVDDSHDPSAIDKGWVMAKTATLSEAAVKKSIESGAFYASNGPSFGVLGVMKNAITASSPNASSIRFIDQEGKVVAEGPASWATYRPSGTERWIRVEAVTGDGRTAWSQPFWLMPNAPKVAFTSIWGGGMALVGQTIPGARVHVSDRGEYLGSVVANDRGDFIYRSRRLTNEAHDFWVLSTAPWPDHVEGPPTLFAYAP
jgi:hypothetical protein